jgi:acetate---CoA ligase (ADP-forming)
MPLEMAAQLSAEDITPMMGLDDALTAFEAAAFIGKSWKLNSHLHSINRPPREGGDPALQKTRRARKSWVPASAGMTEFEGKKLLEEFGLSIPQGQLCTPTTAVTTANILGYPVALKISSATILHKTEVGGVALNLRNAAEVKAAAFRMATLGDKLLIEKMVTGNVAELIIGVKSDPQFGLALVIGAGGIFTELLKDSVTLLLPCSEVEILRALKSLRVWKLIEGFRGKSGDQTATVEAIKSVCKFAAAFEGKIEELDINPLFVLQNGAVAADALVRFMDQK